MSMRKFIGVSLSGHDNPGMELTDTGQSARESFASSGSITSGSVVRSVTQWASYARGRWKKARGSERKKHSVEAKGSTYKGLAWDDDALDGAGDRQQQLNKRLLDHFRFLAASNKDTDEVDLQYLNGVLAEGADPNSADKYGQTVLHEISRAWNVDVMRFFLERGAELHMADRFGVTALHVAAALDYEDMIRFLLERGANIEARTHEDRQTPLHFAAKNDAIGAIQILQRSGADIAAQDYKQRTPLQLAANLERSEAARTLLESGADAGVQDSDGQLCITALISNMTSVASLALNQFHVKDRTTRQQFYYLQLLEPEPTPTKSSHGEVCSETTSPLETVVRQGKLDLIMHPVLLKLITVKWKLYGRLGAWILLLLNFLFIVCWTVVALSVSVAREEGKRYVFPQDWWRVLVVVLALLLTGWEVYRELMEIGVSDRKLKACQRWSQQRLRADLAHTHPMWPEERNYLEEQMKSVRKLKGNYLQDPWNIFDWLVYILLIAILGLHLADIYLVSETLRMYSLRIFAVAIIFLWLRLLKHVRAFRVMGPFIVMLGKIAGDVLRFLFLYAEIYIPYACAFWIIFGGLASVPSMQTVPQMLYSLYRITLVDEYEFTAMVAVDSIMAHLLCGTFLALSAVLCVNLMIALLSDTFQRVYDNALANAVMQQASIILQVEECMPRLRQFYDDRYVHRCCAPLGEFYDDDIITDPNQHEEMKKITVQVKDILDQYLNIQKESNPTRPAQAAGNSRAPRHSSSSVFKDEHLSTLHKLKKNQKQQNEDLQDLRADVKKLQELLLQLIQSTKQNEGFSTPSTESSWSGTRE